MEDGEYLVQLEISKRKQRPSQTVEKEHISINILEFEDEKEKEIVCLINISNGAVIVYNGESRSHSSTLVP
jgi:hypothetical protein